MGTQGEIYNVLGLILPAVLVEENQLYHINHRMVGASYNYEMPDQYDFESGISIPNLKKPTLDVRILGHTNEMGSRHFKGAALVGYSIANESYMSHATTLPPMEEIDALRPKLVKDFKKQLGVTASTDMLELHLIFDWMQGF